MFKLSNKISTISKNPDLITFSIISDGKEISKKVKVISISVQKELNRIPVAKIILIDGLKQDLHVGVSRRAQEQPGLQRQGADDQRITACSPETSPAGI